MSLKLHIRKKFTLEQAVKAQKGSKGNSSTLSLTLALDGVDGQRHTLAALPQGKTQNPLYRRLGGPQGRMRKISSPQGFDPRTAQSVESRYTD